MLGKLIKYEWKNTYKVGGILLITMFIFTVLCMLSFQSPMWQAAFNGTDYETNPFLSPIDMLAIMTLILYFIMLMCVSYGIMIYLGVHFYKTMYTDEGYLIHTLPVKKYQILNSKIFIGGIWMLIISAAMVVSIIAVICGIVMPLVEPSASEMSIWEAICFVMEELWMEIKLAGMTGSVVHFIISMILMVLIAPFGGIAIMYGAISMGQLFSKYRVMMAIFCYIGVIIVNYIISMFIQLPITIRAVSTDDIFALYNSTYDAAILLNVVMAAIMYFVAHYVITKRLNME